MKKISQTQRVLDYIVEHGSITALDAFRDLYITRLSGRIYDLRDAGVPIYDEYEISENGARYAIYKIEEEWLNERQERLDQAHS